MTDTIRFDVEGMTCASCAVRIERVLGKQEGVDLAVVNFASQEARATIAEGVDVEALHAAVAKIGYDIVEIGPADKVYTEPKHPYTRALISAVPKPDPRSDRADRIVLQGDIPTPLDKPSGCGFRTRCPMAKPACAESRQVLKDVGPGHQIACQEVTA